MTHTTCDTDANGKEVLKKTEKLPKFQFQHTDADIFAQSLRAKTIRNRNIKGSGGAICQFANTAWSTLINNHDWPSIS